MDLTIYLCARVHTDICLGIHVYFKMRRDLYTYMCIDTFIHVTEGFLFVFLSLSVSLFGFVSQSFAYVGVQQENGFATNKPTHG